MVCETVVWLSVSSSPPAAADTPCSALTLATADALSGEELVPISESIV